MWLRHRDSGLEIVLRSLDVMTDLQDQMPAMKSALSQFLQVCALYYLIVFVSSLYMLMLHM